MTIDQAKEAKRLLSILDDISRLQNRVKELYHADKSQKELADIAMNALDANYYYVVERITNL